MLKKKKKLKITDNYFSIMYLVNINSSVNY